MKLFNGSAWLLVGAMAASGTVDAQVPAGNDTSDHNGNTGMGGGALGGPAESNAGADNTATGDSALQFNTTGSRNTASGSGALQLNTIGSNNTASGQEALRYNTTGSGNTAAGLAALQANTAGNYNTAAGAFALEFNTTGSNNTASGSSVLGNNTTGENNTALGGSALFTNTRGNNNTAAGVSALYAATGSNNIGIGYEAGYKLTSGGNNIDIGNAGASADNKVIRIGTAGSQTKTFIAGIYGESVTGSPVYVAANGQLGVVVSSERFKTNIAPVGDDTSKLEQLRPVSFHLKTDPTAAMQYGLIAEEVERVYPELVIRDAEGQIQGVRYDELAPLLLSEVQRQRRQMAAAGEKAAAQDQTIKAQADQLVELTARVSELTRQMAKIRQLNESAQAASMRRPANSDRVATRRRRSVERAPTISGPRSS
jgi:hypothetical protein